jgi:UDP-2,4-diacetamido-2,4,6-trideoxy-beta-L-altropyranose hydrolase
MHTKQEIVTQTKVFFRADGNSQIGLGHVMRLLALVDIMKDDFECHFIIQNPSEAIQQQILTVCSNIHSIPQTQHYHQEAEQIVHQYLSPEDIIILDGYNFNSTYQKVFKNNGNSLICIDDVPAFHFYADTIINHAAGINPLEYSVEPYTQLCLGLDYALLRRPFLEAAKQPRTLKSFDKVFICFGGADANNLTQQASEVCVNLASINQIHVVLGSAYNSYQEFISFASQHSHLKVHQNLNATEMCALMQSCDVAIT